MFLGLYVYFLLAFSSFVVISKNITISKKPLNQTVIVVLNILFALILFLARDIWAPADSVPYKLMYENSHSIQNALLVYHGSLFFSFLFYIGNILGISSNVFFTLFPILLYIFYCIAFYYLFDKNKQYVCVTQALLVCSSTYIFYFMNILRQGLAFVVLLYAIIFFSKRKWFSFLIASLFAIFSHISALVVILFMILSRIYLKIRITHLKFFLLSILFLVSGYVLKNAITILALKGNILIFHKEILSNNFHYIKIIIGFALINLQLLLAKKKFLFENENFRSIFYLSVCVYLLSIFTLFSHIEVSSRIMYYFSAFLPIIFSFIILSDFRVFKANQELLLIFFFTFWYAIFVYNFGSIRTVLGI